MRKNINCSVSDQIFHRSSLMYILHETKIKLILYLSSKMNIKSDKCKVAFIFHKDIKLERL